MARDGSRQALWLSGFQTARTSMIISTPDAMFVFVHSVGLCRVGFKSQGAWMRDDYPWMTDLKGPEKSVALLSLPAPLQPFHSPSVPFSLHHSQPISSVHPRREPWLMKLSQARNPNHTKRLLHIAHCVTSCQPCTDTPYSQLVVLIHQSTKCPGELVSGSANQPKMSW